MSAQLLRDGTRTDLENLILVHQGYLERIGDSLDHLRVNQGIVAGLRLAINCLNERYREQHG